MSSGGFREAAKEPMAAEIPAGARTEQRISWLTLIIGLLAGLLIAVLRDLVWGVGVGIGTVLAWVNFPFVGARLNPVGAPPQGPGRKEKAASPAQNLFAVANP